MARVPDTLGSLPPDAQKVYDRITAKRGKIGGPYVPLMHHHVLAEHVSELASTSASAARSPATSVSSPS